MKKLLKIFFGLFIFIIAALVIFFLTFDLNTYKGMITEAASKALGRPVYIDSLEMKLSLIPTVKARGVRVANPAGFPADKPMLMTNSVEATLAVMPLFSRQIEVRDFSLGLVGVNLIDNGEGNNNWSLPKEDTPVAPTMQVNRQATAEDWLQGMRIDSITAEKITLSYTRQDSNKSLIISNFSLKQLKAFSFTTAYDNITMKVSGTTNSILDFIQQKPNYLFNVEVQALNATAKISGSIGDTKDFKNMLLNVSASGSGLSKTAELLGIKNKKIPTGAFDIKAVVQGDLTAFQLTEGQMTLNKKASLSVTGDIKDMGQDVNATFKGNVTVSDAAFAADYGLKPLTTQFEVAVVPSQIEVKSLLVQANQSVVQLNGDIVLSGEKPTLNVTVASDSLDIQDIVTDSLEKTEPKRAQAPAQSVQANGLIPDTKIDLSALNTVNAKVAFALPYIRLSNSQAGSVGATGTLTLTDGELNVHPLKLRLLEGEAAGSVKVDARTTPYQVAVRLTGTDFNLNRLKDVTAFVKDATVDFDIDLTTRGTSTKTLIADLNGRMAVEVPQGIIVNKWFNTLPAVMGAVRSKTNSLTFSTSDQESHILCGAVNFAVQNGRMIGENAVAIETSSINFLVGGTIDLNTEAMSLTMVPSLNGEQDDVNRLLSAAQLIRIAGTFTKPTASLATDKVAQNALQFGVDKLMQKVGIEKPTTGSAYGLCRRVLGYQSKAEKQAALKEELKKQPQPIVQEQPEPQPQPVLSPKEQFKNELLKSISEALQ